MLTTAPLPTRIFSSAPVADPPAASAAAATDAPEVIVYSDIDDTFLGRDDQGLETTREVLRAHAGQTANGLCTGRGLGQSQILADRLGSFPMQFFGVNNGLFVYHNDEGLPAGTFLAGLNPSKADPDWTEEIRRRTNGWQMSKIITTMLDVVGERGFTPAPPTGRAFNLEGDIGGEHLRVSYYLDQPSFNIRNVDAGASPVARATGDAIAAEIESRMAAQQIGSTHYAIADHGQQVIYGFQPPGIDKKALLEYELKRMPSVRAVITAGDNVNDTHLDPLQYGSVPNYRVLAGDHHPHGDDLAGQERVLRAPSGAIGPAVEAHLQAIGVEAPDLSRR